ncbi:response regulator [Actomonas aquatica]|uniref:Response regulator n=1 Tax=Actomonas aquatica TaxID=2866162 RepID=A0ABZ1CCW3_9BACT|nr:response regulator [Opitutus sp. WL0086]WRQ88140.1 response regulator [Opitutus sp. WL0086]
MPRILIADDNDELLEFQRLFLNENGYNVLTATNGDEAVRLIRENDDIDLLVTDVLMPDKEGVETILELRSIAPDLPVIAISGGGHVGAVDYLQLARSAGAKATLAKPCPPSVLLATIRQILGESV